MFSVSFFKIIGCLDCDTIRGLIGSLIFVIAAVYHQLVRAVNMQYAPLVDRSLIEIQVRNIKYEFITDFVYSLNLDVHKYTNISFNYH